MTAWRYEISLLVFKEKFRISARPCNIYIDGSCFYGNLLHHLSSIPCQVIIVVLYGVIMTAIT